ncbi:hypothetical protein D915_004603 [Fasciola hepatica]|uniref:Uncharacterized protein n=1 Tax=Fasciola hepatica TaxID=6192 RepID=A0A4E0RUI0_FASHE|nr:hypothetical protein D915_004603 [Fasciola hepatica]
MSTINTFAYQSCDMRRRELCISLEPLRLRSLFWWQEKEELYVQIISKKPLTISPVNSAMRRIKPKASYRMNQVNWTVP